MTVLEEQDPLIASISLSEIKHRYVHPEGLGDTEFTVPHLMFVDLPYDICGKVAKEFSKAYAVKALGLL